MHAQTKSNYALKSSDPLNLPMTPKFINKGSSMTLKNSGLAETLSYVTAHILWVLKRTIPKHIDEWLRMGLLPPPPPPP